MQQCILCIQSCAYNVFYLPVTYIECACYLPVMWPMRGLPATACGGHFCRCQAFGPSRTCLSRDPVEYRIYSLPTHIIKGCEKRCVALLPDRIVALVPSQIPWSLWARIWHVSHAPAYNGTPHVSARSKVPYSHLPPHSPQHLRPHGST
jgi:hypothetical protein